MRKRIGILLVSFMFILFPKAEIYAATPILGGPTTYAAQMKEWARTRDASETFIELADSFYELAVARGVDPAVVYAQSAKETAFGRYGNIVDESFFNTCGLKTTAGGGNNDPQAHQRFSSWQEGITAQIEHLALYAGIITANPKDPRHFESVRGVAPTVEELGGKWAPSATYGTEILNNMNELRTTSIQSVHYRSGGEIYISDYVEIKNGVITAPSNMLLPIKDICAALGVQYFWQGEKKEIHIPAENLVFTVDSKTYTDGGEVKKLPYAPAIVDGSTLVPLSAFCNIFDKYARAEIEVLSPPEGEFFVPAVLSVQNIKILAEAK